jgi:membrane-bound ClpP family serine protease
MSDERNLARILRDATVPVMLILIGALFLLNQYVPTLSIARTWPIILIVLGVLWALRSFAPPRPPRGPQMTPKL